jgi:hypothetical protein
LIAQGIEPPSRKLASAAAETGAGYAAFPLTRCATALRELLSAVQNLFVPTSTKHSAIAHQLNRLEAKAHWKVVTGTAASSNQHAECVCDRVILRSPPEPNDEWAVQYDHSMKVETIAPIDDGPAVSVPAFAS